MLHQGRKIKSQERTKEEQKMKLNNIIEMQENQILDLEDMVRNMEERIYCLLNILKVRKK